MKKAIFFDLDGTLIDSERYYLEGAYVWMKEQGFTGTVEDLYGTVGVTFDESYRLMQSYLPHLTVEDVRRINEDYFLNREPLRYKKLLFPETDRVLKELAGKYTLCICSNDPKSELDHFLSECGYEDLFTHVLSCEDIKNAKPDPEIFLKARDLLGLSSEECLIVEDSFCGIAAGKASGIYTTARKSPFPCDQSAADRILETLNDLTEVLKEFSMSEDNTIKIVGRKKLEGEVRISSSKNAAVALIPATVMGSDIITLYDVPHISDIAALKELLAELNIKVERKDDALIVDPREIRNTVLESEAVGKLRASYYFMGALLGRYKRVKMKMPGGCDLGPRPIDLHLKGFRALGAQINYVDGFYTIEAPELVGADIYLDFASVGATINIMMAAVFAKGRTVIDNAAKEPEIIDLSTMLNKMGADIRGAGTSSIIINGVERLNGCAHEIIPDRIEAGTYIIIAAACANHMRISNIIPMHLDALLKKLEEMGVNMEIGDDYIDVFESKELKGTSIKTLPYPGLATDLQQPLTTLMTQAVGVSKVRETIYKERFKHCAELNKMGAEIEVLDGNSVINGPTPLFGTEVRATDLRCGASLVIAGLIAKGETTINDAKYIYRGYDHIKEKLRALGAEIS